VVLQIPSTRARILSDVARFQRLCMDAMTTDGSQRHQQNVYRYCLLRAQRTLREFDANAKVLREEHEYLKLKMKMAAI